MAVQEKVVGVARAKLADLREAVVGVALTACKVRGTGMTQQCAGNETSFPDFLCGNETLRTLDFDCYWPRPPQAVVLKEGVGGLTGEVGSSEEGE